MSDVFASCAVGVGLHSFIYVVCCAGVERAILAFEDVDEPLFFHYSFRFFFLAQDEQTRAVSFNDM